MFYIYYCLNMYLNIWFFLLVLYLTDYGILHIILYIADVAEWSKALDVSDWCCSVSMVSWNPIEGRTKSCQLKDLILTVLFNFQTYIYESLIVFKGVSLQTFLPECVYLYTWNWVEIIKCFKMFSWIKTPSVQIIFVHRTL